MKIAAAYIRVSTDDQVEFSPDSQIGKITEYAKKNNLTIPPEYIFRDDGISGKDAKHRPSFNDMIALAKSPEHPFDVILVWKFSRFARNQEESIVYKNLLRKKNVEVRSVTEPIIDGAFGTLIERIIEWMDEYYLVNLSVEVKRGMLERASRGQAVSVPAVGYDLADGELVPNSDSPLVNEIFARFANGETKSTITSIMQSKGLRTGRGNPVDLRCVDYILHNPIYVGKIRWSVDGRAASLRDFDNINIRVYDGHHQPIVSEDLWNKVQERLAKMKSMYNKNQKSTAKTEFSLRGLLRCSSCGCTLTNSADGWQCANYATKRGCTESHYISKSIAEETVIRLISEAVADLNFNIIPHYEAVTVGDNSELINAEKRKLARVKKAYESGADTLEEYAENKKRIMNAIRKLEAEQPKQEAVSPAEFGEKVSSVLELLKKSTDEREKNQVLRTIIDYVIFDRKACSFTVVFKQL